MNLSRERLLVEAAATGFRAEVLEKVIRLLALLEGLRSHPFLKGRFALKGGTAINLFVFDVPRLSVDIDLNYIGAVERDRMLAEKPKVEAAVRAVCEREGLVIRRTPLEHAGGKWSLRYRSPLGQGGDLELDLNFMLRMPLWPIMARDSQVIGSYQAKGIPVLNEHELAAGKLAALFARHVCRDLFDVNHLLSRGGFNRDRLRLAFVIYGAINRKDWRTVSTADADFEASELRNLLISLLRQDVQGRIETSPNWVECLVEECRARLEIVLPLEDHELEFLNRLLDHGEIEPSVLTKDSEMIERIRSHPGLKWKALNVKQFKGR
ncbi:MAG: hypothetical protein HW385_918 [candidate division NC10 bacterium]|nr:hypothetical protein [candidate division NC10 bacterium]